MGPMPEHGSANPVTSPGAGAVLAVCVLHPLTRAASIIAPAMKALPLMPLGRASLGPGCTEPAGRLAFIHGPEP
jgi:hypothetical protein